MPLSGEKTQGEVFNKTVPTIIDTSKYVDPYKLVESLRERTELPQETVDVIKTVRSKCYGGMKGTISGFLSSSLDTVIGFDTDNIQYIQTKTPSYSLNTDGAVTRSGDVFTIDFTVLPGYVAGEDNFFMKAHTNIIVVDNANVKENGIIESIDKANNTFTAKTKNGAAWTVDTSNISISFGGGDYPKASCAPESIQEIRKRTTHTQRFAEVKKSVEDKSDGRFKFCVDGEDGWSSVTSSISLREKMHKAIDWNCILDIESADGSSAHSSGYYGSLGLLQNIKKNGLEFTGGINTVSDMEELDLYYSQVLGLDNMTFNVFATDSQYRKLEIIASQLAQSLNVTMNVALENAPDNIIRLGFKGFVINGNTYRFAKWNPTSGNSDFTGRLSTVFPEAIIVPEGTVDTTINGVSRRVPYMFKGYKDFGDIGNGKYGGMIRTMFDGAFFGIGSCEKAEISEAANVGIVVPCPEALCMITK